MSYACNGMKKCGQCQRTLPVDKFHKDHSRLDGLKPICKDCARDRRREFSGTEGEDKNKSCARYLGIHIAEPYLLEYFGNAERMPSGNPGYDFLCSKGYKIDVKASCKIHRPDCTIWSFCTAFNQIADYFFCIAYNNRESLHIEHVWLIPGELGRDKRTIHIGTGPRSLSRWKQYELEIKPKKVST